MKKLLCGCALLMAGCSSPNPETEPPVELLAGSYEVLVGGPTLVQLKSGDRRGLICIDSGTTFKSDPLAQITSGWGECSDDYAEPKGNALVGTRKCDRKTPVLVQYKGSHTADSFEFKGTVSQGSDETDAVMRLGSGEFSVSGKRVGDCVS